MTAKTIQKTPASRRGRKPFADIDRVLDAARDCFGRYGVERTKLEDVAAEAGISRQLLYRIFGTRRSLLDAAINREVEAIVSLQREQMTRYTDFDEAVVEVSLTGIRLVRENKIFLELYAGASATHLPGLLVKPGEPAHEFVLSLWQPTFDRARKSGELRKDLTDHDLIEWLMAVNYTFITRDDLTPERQKELLTLFVIPALKPVRRSK